MRDHFAAYRRMAKRRHPEDREGVEIPAPLRYLWTYFWDLNCGRPITQAGYGPIPAVEFRAWEELNEVKLRSWELGALKKIDALFLKVMIEKVPGG
jgi:hypothetical protein